MRGKVHKMNHSDLCSRITPAYAGKRHSLFHSTEVEQDHPRLCGEKSRNISQVLIMQGSPPPMRGKVECHLKQFAGNRITPAYAGKRLDFYAFSFSLWDHPRLCGEKLVVSTSNSSRHRITPAYAGKRKGHQAYSQVSWDHPRLCGEKFTLSFTPLQ